MRIGIIQKLLAIVFLTMALTLFLANYAHRGEAHAHSGLGNTSISLTVQQR